MNILFLSHLSGASYAGPTYSVPMQIEAQSKIDNVFWYNAVQNSKKDWKNISYYHDLNDYPNESIKSLPHPFDSPDIIVVELFYNMAKSPLLKELVNGKIPYVIIPRGELTKQAQKRKSLKKYIANLIIFNQYARNAAAIHFLTEQEKNDSSNKWNKNYFVIPNGINKPTNCKHSFKNGIKCVSIGRIEPYQKGLDLLIEACSLIKNDMEKYNCTISIYGPDKENKLEELKEYVKNKNLTNIVSFKDAVFGEEKEEVLFSSDVFLIPSRFEGHPMALIEALSFGLPCVATTGSNMRKEIEEYDCGWTADCTAESLSIALKNMLYDKKLFQNKSKNAILLSKNYQWNILAKKAHNEYMTLINMNIK